MSSVSNANIISLTCSCTSFPSFCPLVSVLPALCSVVHSMPYTLSNILQILLQFCLADPMEAYPFFCWYLHTASDYIHVVCPFAPEVITLAIRASSIASLTYDPSMASSSPCTPPRAQIQQTHKENAGSSHCLTSLTVPPFLVHYL